MREEIGEDDREEEETRRRGEEGRGERDGMEEDGWMVKDDRR